MWWALCCLLILTTYLHIFPKHFSTAQPFYLDPHYNLSKSSVLSLHIVHTTGGELRTFLSIWCDVPFEWDFERTLNIIKHMRGEFNISKISSYYWLVNHTIGERRCVFTICMCIELLGYLGHLDVKVCIYLLVMLFCESFEIPKQVSYFLFSFLFLFGDFIGISSIDP